MTWKSVHFADHARIRFCAPKVAFSYTTVQPSRLDWVFQRSISPLSCQSCYDQVHIAPQGKLFVSELLIIVGNYKMFP